MEAIKHALGYDTEATTTTDNSISGGQAPQHTGSLSNTQSGVEPVSGRLGTGSAGQPYDAGNEDYSSGTTAYGDANTSTLGAGGNRQAGNSYNALDSQRGTGAGYGSESGQTGYGQTGYGQTGSGLTGTSSGYGQTGTNSGSTVGKIESALGLGGATSGSQREYASGNSRSGLSGGNSGLSDGQNLSSGGYSSGLSGSNRPSSGSEALGDLTGEGSRTQAHGHAIQGSDLGVGKGGERYLYDSRTAPGYGGRSHDDDFSHANVHNVGSGKDIMSDLGSTVAAGHSDGAAASGVGSTSTSESRPTRSGLNRTGTGMGGGSSGLMSGMSSNNRNYDNTSGQSGYGSGAGAAAGITSGLAAVGLADHQRGNTVESYEGQQGISQGFTGGIQPSAGVAEDSSYTNKPYSRGTDFLSSGITRDSQAGAINQDTTGYGSRGVSNNNTSDDFAAGAPVSGYTSSGSGPAGASHNAAGLTNFGGHHHRSISDDLDDGCEGSAKGYQPHGGHPIGEAAHQTAEGKSTWLNYHDDPKVVLGEKLEDAKRVL